MKLCKRNSLLAVVTAGSNRNTLTIPMGCDSEPDGSGNSLTLGTLPPQLQARAEAEERCLAYGLSLRCRLPQPQGQAHVFPRPILIGQAESFTLRANERCKSRAT
jgi:hypothetical protein